MTRGSLAAWCVLALAPPVAAADPGPAPWRIDPKLSTIEFSATQAGAKFDGRFARWTGDIRFEPKDLAHSRALVSVLIGSVDTRSTERDAALQSAAWFDPVHWPQATFQTLAIRATATGYEADARLTIRGRARPVKFLFQVQKSAGGKVRLTGTARLARLAFGLGEGEFASTEWVGDQVDVKVVVVAHSP